MILLPLIVAGLLAALFYGLTEDRRLSWRGAFLYASVVWGVLLVVVLEGLSLLRSINPITLTAAWFLILLFIAILGWRNGCYQITWRRLRVIEYKMAWAEWLFLMTTTAVILTLFIVAINSVPNNTDSLQYHLTRVSHWVQNASLHHFPTAYLPNLMHPIWSEAAILNVRLLSGDNRFASLIQWIAGIGLLLAAAEISAEFGAGRRARWLSAVLVLSAPQFLLQATSTQNDLVVAYWAVIVAWLVVLGKKRPLRRLEQIGLALAVGLGVLTKITFAIYAAPFLLWHFIPYLKFESAARKRFFFEAGITVAAVLVLNAGYWGRNVQTFANPLGSSQVLTSHSNRSADPRAVLAGAVDHAALNFSSPSEAATALVVESARSFRQSLGLEESDFVVLWSWNHEDIAGNPLHFLMLPLAAIGMGLVARRDGFGLQVRYAAASLGSFFLLVLILEASPFSIRYQIGILVLWAPLLAYLADRWLKPRWQSLSVLGLLFLTLPWLLFNQSRPLVGLKPRTSIDSILKEEPSVVLFANWTGLRNDYADAAEAILATSCENVGLALDSHDLEYPIWWFLGAPESGLKLESIRVHPELQDAAPGDFHACAVVCTTCGGRAAWEDLPRVGAFGEINLYGSPVFFQDAP